LIAAAQQESAPVADVEQGLLAVVAPDLPVHERGVVRGLLRIVDDLTGQVIEKDRFPSSRLERQFSGSGIAFRRAGARAAALALRERRYRTRGDGRAQSHQQLPA
jgi:hypothetical protein